MTDENDTISDEALLRAIARDDKKAFEQLFDRHWKKAYRMANFSLKSAEQAQEIVQQLFIDLWERRRDSKIKNFTNYLSVSVKYKAIDFIKNQVVTKKYADYYKIFCQIEEEETFETVKYKDLLSAVEQGVNKLPKKTQMVFRLNRLEGRSIQEIAKEFGLSEKTIQYHLTQSLRHLKLYLKDFYVAVIAALLV